MEKKKNNAVEKAEKVANKNDKERSEKTKTASEKVKKQNQNKIFSLRPLAIDTAQASIAKPIPKNTLVHV